MRVVALGGLGEIGRNMTVFEYAGRLLIVDCGVLFPEDSQPGVDLILPDFSYIEDRLDDVDAVVLTHGHEDHIGALPFLLRQRSDIPLYGSLWAMACASDKLDPKSFTADEIDRRIEHRKLIALQYYNGETHEGVFALPNFVRDMVAPPRLRQPARGRRLGVVRTAVK